MTKSRWRSFLSASSVHVGDDDDDDDFSHSSADFDKPDSERSSHNQKLVEELLEVVTLYPSLRISMVN